MRDLFLLLLLAFLVLLALLTVACFRPRPATAPLRVVATSAAKAHADLVVFLPGRGDVPEDFAGRGLLAAARAAGLAADVVAVDAHLGYYADKSIARRLHDDVLAPARAAGYERIWLAGISLGALGSIIYLREYPGEVAGAVLVAPFLGDQKLLSQIAAGGVRAWQPPARGMPEDYQVELWRFLQATYAVPADPSRPVTPLWLAYGEDDRYAAGDRLLATLLPPERVLTAPGGHAWGPWRNLWEALLAAGALPRAAALPQSGNLPPTP